jgi:hypothetical protein
MILTTSIYWRTNYRIGDVRCWIVEQPQEAVKAMLEAGALIQVPGVGNLDKRASEELTKLLNWYLEILEESILDKYPQSGV